MCKDRRLPSPVERRRNGQRRSESWMRRIQKNSDGWRWDGFSACFKLQANFCDISPGLLVGIQAAAASFDFLLCQKAAHASCVYSLAFPNMWGLSVGSQLIWLGMWTQVQYWGLPPLFFFELISLFFEGIADVHLALCILSYRKLLCGVSRRNLRRSRWRWSKSKWKLCDSIVRRLSQCHLQNFNSQGTKTYWTP